MFYNSFIHIYNSFYNIYNIYILIFWIFYSFYNDIDSSNHLYDKREYFELTILHKINIIRHVKSFNNDLLVIFYYYLCSSFYFIGYVFR
jgi:hypothetical protein